MKTIIIKGMEVPAEWRGGETYTAVVSVSDDEFKSDAVCGGHFICDSVPFEYRPLIIKSPQLFSALKDLVFDVSSGALDSASLRMAAELIEELETP